MEDSILKVAEHLENGTIDSDKARSLLLNLFGVSGSLQPLTIDNVNKILKKVSKETWDAAQGDEHGWREWYAERCKLNLNSNDPQIGYDTMLSAGICDTCSIPKMMNSGDGVNEPLDPILYCHKMKREICPEPPEDRMVECRFYTCR